MNTWRFVLSVTATAALAGCTANVDAPGGTGAMVGVGAATGTGGTGTGGTGTGGGGAVSSGGSAGVINPNCAPGVATTSQIPRITNAEYDRTVRDLLGLSTLTAMGGSVPSNLLATDQAGGLTDVGWAAYKTVGEAIATQVMGDATLKTKFITCDPAVGTCLHDTAVSFGRKAFRRPLTPDEVAAFDAVIAAGKDITPTGAPAEVAEALLYMFLVSPSFLMREELTDKDDGAGHKALSNWEVASRMSYLLWGSTPDDALNQAADAGMLSTPAQILTQAQRMVKDPKARDMVQTFHRYYMLMGLNTRWDNTNHDSTLFPAFSTGIVGILQQETEMFFDNLVFQKNATFKDLLTSNVAFVSAATAPLYGLNPASFGTNLTETTLDANHPGFLTRLGFLNAYSGYSHQSPILRGAFITKQVLGIAIGAPPPGAEKTPLPPQTADINTMRKQVDAMTAGTDCAGCHHNFINPPGFALESFNAVGSWQTKDQDTGAPIDTVTDVLLDADAAAPVHVTGPADLMKAIATAPGAELQYASKWVSYGYEREGNAADACTVQQLAAKMTTSGYSVLNLVADLTQTLSFRVRVADQ
jgi:hypothetical protein